MLDKSESGYIASLTSPRSDYDPVRSEIWAEVALSASDLGQSGAGPWAKHVLHIVSRLTQGQCFTRFHKSNSSDAQ